MLLDAGARIRGVRGLHAKVYLLGRGQVIVTSANLTEAGLCSNHEFGMVSADGNVASGCWDYFRDLWRRAGPDLKLEQLEDWDATVNAARLAAGRPSFLDGLADEGADIGLPEAPPIGGAPREAPIPPDPYLDLADDAQVFVKFFGRGQDRVSQTFRVIDEVARSGSHWACTYPRHPWQAQDGSLMSLGRLVKDPPDIRIFGRAIGQSHNVGRDEATPEEIRNRPWKAHWRYYIRVHDAVFVEGPLSGGISLYGIMDELGARAFATTRARQLKGERHINPRLAYARQPAVQLSAEGARLISERMPDAFRRHGTVQPATLEQLDWPDVRHSG
jgi:hypothetical protein